MSTQDKRTNTGALAAPSAIHIIAKRFEVATTNLEGPVKISELGISFIDLGLLLGWTHQRMVDCAEACSGDFAWSREDMAGWIADDLFNDEEPSRAWAICELAKWPRRLYTTKREFVDIIADRWPEGTATLLTISDEVLIDHLEAYLKRLLKDDSDDCEACEAARFELAQLEAHGVPSWMAGRTFSEAEL